LGQYPLGSIEFGKLIYELHPFRIDVGQSVGNALPVRSDIVQNGHCSLSVC
jgi:hypothetical protein